MLGAIAGDVMGSPYEGGARDGSWVKLNDFPLFHPDCRFTDDTVLTVAVADSLLNGLDLVDLFHAYFRRYPRAGYGDRFIKWARARDRLPYRSWGNGSAMRVAPVGWAFATIDAVMAAAATTAEVTHNHPEGIKGAQAVAAAVFLARTGSTKDDVKTFVSRTFGYDLDEPLSKTRLHYSLDVSCAGTVPQSIRAFLEATDFASAVRLAISLGGDTDTMACMAGAVAEAFYGGVPGPIKDATLAYLDPALRQVVDEFRARYRIP